MFYCWSVINGDVNMTHSTVASFLYKLRPSICSPRSSLLSPSEALPASLILIQSNEHLPARLRTSAYLMSLRSLLARHMVRSCTHSQDSPSSRSQFHPAAEWRSSHGMGKGFASRFVLMFKKSARKRAGFRRGSGKACPRTKFHASALAAATRHRAVFAALLPHLRAI